MFSLINFITQKECDTWVQKQISMLSDAEFSAIVEDRLAKIMSTKILDTSFAEYIVNMEQITPKFIPVNYVAAEESFLNVKANLNKLIEDCRCAINNKDRSILTSDNGFDVRSNNQYIVISKNFPFRCKAQCSTEFTDADQLIDYLKTVKSSKIGQYNNGKFIKGMNESITEGIRELYKAPGIKVTFS